VSILVVGDNCIDKYVYGNVTRISPEAPVPVFEVVKEEASSGMAANVNENLKALGAKTNLIVPSAACVKTRYVDMKTNYQMLRVDQDYTLTKAPVMFGDFKKYDAIVISDYNKGFVTHDMIYHLRDNFNGPIFMDTKKKELGGFDDIYIKINEKEYKEAKSLPFSNRLIVTKGGEGAEYMGKLYESEKTNVFDVTGAGDTFLAALVIEFLKSKSIPKAIEFANKCAAITVQHSGCYVLKKHDIIELFTL
jgi:bifunctional ADP-heptose synthase (sugar kinase/adenylyltransferase)